LYPLYSTNVTTSHLVVHPFCSNAMLLRGILCMLLYSYAFLHRKYAGLFPCYTFYRLAACTAFLSLFLFFSILIFGHSYLKCPIPQHLKYLTSSTISFLLILIFSLTLHLITLLNNTLFYHLISPYPYFFSHPTSYYSTQ